MRNAREIKPRPSCSAILLLAMLSVSVAAGAVQAQEPGGRIMPPSGLKCDRNDLTLYDGKVLTYAVAEELRCSVFGLALTRPKQ